MKKGLKILAALHFILTAVGQVPVVIAQSQQEKKTILIDVAHGQRFVADPKDVAGRDQASIKRANYIAAELAKNAEDLGAQVAFHKAKFTPASLKSVDVLFMQGASIRFDQSEVEAIRNFVAKGGGLFITMDEDYWGTLDQINVNDIVKPFGIEYKQNNPISTSGGYAQAGVIAKQRWSIPVHGARIVEGGTPFCFINSDSSKPFGVYKEVPKGGRIIAMGDGMAALYMSKWQNVDKYQCSQFMQDAFRWLLD